MQFECSELKTSSRQTIKSTEHRKSARNTADVQADNPTSTSTPSPAIAIQTQSSARCARQSHGRSPWRTQSGTMMKLNPSTRRRDARTLRPTLACCSPWASTLQVLLWAPNSHVLLSLSLGCRAAASHWPCVTQELGSSGHCPSRQLHSIMCPRALHALSRIAGASHRTMNSTSPTVVLRGHDTWHHSQSMCAAVLAMAMQAAQLMQV